MNINYQNRSGGVSLAGLVCLLCTFLVSGSLFWLAIPQTESKIPTASSTVPIGHQPIQQIRPGQWVNAENPSEEDDLEFGAKVDPTTWKLLTLKAPKQDGTVADVCLLRPDQWLRQQAATVGKTVYISVPECGIEGDAQVLRIEECPPIATNPGPGFQVVTGTFRHQSAQTLDIAVEGEAKPIGTTPNHPFWSADREAFVRADSLSVGERLQTLKGITKITSISPRGPPEPVYNLEVQVKHTYHVADSGVLVHNGAPCPIGAETVEVWRIVEKGELDDIVQRGYRYHSPPGKTLTPTGQPGKWFYGSKGDALDTAKDWSKHGTEFFLTKTKVPKNSLNNVYKGIDGTSTTPLGKDGFFVEMSHLLDKLVVVVQP